MNLLFLLGAYRPEHCGVSDYVALLSEKLEALGHSCRIVSIDTEKGSSLASVSSALPPADIVSLQFAPYAFHPKGLPGRPLLQLAEALAKRPLQVTFHEIWTGAYPRASLWERFTGNRQRREILNFLRIARPKGILTTNAASIDRLQRENLSPEYLYLFGNVPLAAQIEKIDEVWPKAKSTIAFFGTPYSDFPYRRLFQTLAKTYISMKCEPTVRILGGIREAKGLNLLRKEAERLDLAVETTGRLSTEELSLELQAATYGVATTPFDALGKSGSAAAMLEHGLPVVAHDDGDTPKDALFAPGPFKERIVLLTQKDFTNRLKTLIGTPKPPFFDGVTYTANSFISFLTQA